MAFGLTWDWSNDESNRNTVEYNSGEGSIFIFSNESQLGVFALNAVDSATEAAIKPVLDYTDGYAVRFVRTFGTDQIADDEFIGGCLASDNYGASCWIITQTSGSIATDYVSKLYNKVDWEAMTDLSDAENVVEAEF